MTQTKTVTAHAVDMLETRTSLTTGNSDFGICETA